VFTKRSFLAGYANVTEEAPAEEPDEEEQASVEEESVRTDEDDGEETVAAPDDGDDGGGLSTGVLVALGVVVLGGLGGLVALRGRNKAGTVED
jgi:hypothetical protein